MASTRTELIQPAHGISPAVDVEGLLGNWYNLSQFHWLSTSRVPVTVCVLPIRIPMWMVPCLIHGRRRMISKSILDFDVNDKLTVNRRPELFTYRSSGKAYAWVMLITQLDRNSSSGVSVSLTIDRLKEYKTSTGEQRTWNRISID